MILMVFTRDQLASWLHEVQPLEDKPELDHNCIAIALVLANCGQLWLQYIANLLAVQLYIATRMIRLHLQISYTIKVIFIEVPMHAHYKNKGHTNTRTHACTHTQILLAIFKTVALLFSKHVTIYNLCRQLCPCKLFANSVT